MSKPIPTPPTPKKITKDKTGERCFPIVRTSKGVEYLILNKRKLKLVQTTSKEYKFLILKK